MDGNPIREGQLVEEASDPHVIRRVDEVEPDYYGRTMIRSAGVRRPSLELRVLTADDLHRPPVPDTRDVTLRVVVLVGGTLTADDVAEDVSAALEEYGMDESAFTVEVIEDGDSHE